MASESMMAMIRPVMQPSIHMPRRAHPFCARDFLRIDTAQSKQVPIERCEPSFFGDFIAGGGVIEKPLVQEWVPISIYEITEHFRPVEFFCAYGSPDDLVHNLSVLHALIVLQSEGADFLLKDGSENSFLIKNLGGNARHVRISWGVAGWRLLETKDPYDVSYGKQSRLFLPSSKPTRCMAA